MSEQNPSAEVPPVPSAPRQSDGSEPVQEAAAVTPQAQETLGSAPAPQETLGSAPAGHGTERTSHEGATEAPLAAGGGAVASGGAAAPTTEAAPMADSVAAGGAVATAAPETRSDATPPAEPPTPPAPPAAAEPPAAEPKKKRGLAGLLVPVILLVVVLAAAGWYYFAVYRLNPQHASTGQCLSGTTATELNADNLKIADCASPDAAFKVVGRVDDKPQADTEAACKDTNPPTTFYFWTGSEGKNGTVLCLADNH